MSVTQVVRTIDAPVDRVFRAVGDVRNFAQIAEDIVRIEFLSDQQKGAGTRFRETREMRGKEQQVTLELTEYVEDDHVRFISDEHDTVWDSVFKVRPVEGRTELTLTMEARAYKLLPKLINPLIKSMIAKAVAKDMDAVKAWCERPA